MPTIMNRKSHSSLQYNIMISCKMPRDSRLALGAACVMAAFNSSNCMHRIRQVSHDNVVYDGMMMENGISYLLADKAWR
jgi:hypothetical protein